MKLHFLGANRQVTGSRYCLETAQSRILIDCGMFQERIYEPRNWQPSPIEPDSVNAVVLTHAHIDHCGLLPRFVQQGFRGPVYATAPTLDLLEILLRDAARIQQEDALYKAKRHRRENRQRRYTPQPLYDDQAVDRTLPLGRPLALDAPQAITADVHVTARNAGHILGSAELQFTVSEGDREATVVFSGDLGQWNKPILNDPVLLEQADYVVMESTYGDRDHPETGEIEDHLQQVFTRTLGRGGNVVIPTFAVERAQELMYYISRLVYEDRIPDVKVFLDSPMAIDITEIFHKYRNQYDDQAWEHVANGQPPLRFPGLTLSRSTDESMAINAYDAPCVIMSTSGMCTAGRIKHHLRRNLPRRECTVLFVGYQAVGTLGRQILDGNRRVRIHGRDWPVRAEVAQIPGLSAHADRQGLLRWAGGFRSPPRQLFLTHGEQRAAEHLAGRIRATLRWEVEIPEYQSTYDLA